MNTSSRSLLFSNRSKEDSIASRQSKEESLIINDRFKSPFYEGKVSFGGSSAKRVRLSQVLPYNVTNRPTQLMKIKDSDKKRLEEFDQLSNAAKNVLKNICKISSPLEDAKKIPLFTSNTPSEKYMIEGARPFKRLSSLRTPKIVSNLKTSSPIDREKLQLKWEELENSYTTSNNLSQKVINSEAGSFLNSEDNFYAGGKMRTNITRNRLSKNLKDEEYLTHPDLPNISLPINSNSLPTFNFNKQSNTVTKDVNKNETVSLKRSRLPVTLTHEQEDDNLDYEEFQFSAPKLIKLEKISDSFLEKSIRIIDNKEENSVKLTSSNTSNKPDTEKINVDLNKTVEMYKLDKLDTDFNPKENKATLANTDFSTQSKLPDTKISNTFNYDGLSSFNKNSLAAAKKWECDACSVRNEQSAKKCIACETPRLKESEEKNVSNIYSNYSFGAINTEKKNFNAFKFDSKVNTSTESTFTSSSAFKADDKANTVSSKTSTGFILPVKDDNKKEKKEENVITNIFKKDEKTESFKINEISKKDEDKSFNFITNDVKEKIDEKKIPTNDWSTQFAPPKGSWLCSICQVNNKPTDKKCICCENPNPNETSTSTNETTSSKSSFAFNPKGTGFSFNSNTSGFSFKTSTDTKSSDSKNEFKINTDASKALQEEKKSTLFSSSNTETKNFSSNVDENIKEKTISNLSTTTSTSKFSFNLATTNSNITSSANQTSGLNSVSWSDDKQNKEWKCSNCSTLNPNVIDNCTKCKIFKKSFSTPNVASEKSSIPSNFFGNLNNEAKNSDPVFKLNEKSSAQSFSQINPVKSGGINLPFNPVPTSSELNSDKFSLNSAKSPVFSFGAKTSTTTQDKEQALKLDSTNPLTSNTSNPSFSFGQPALSSSTSKDNTKFPATNNFVFGSSSTQASTNLTNGGLSFNMPSSTPFFSANSSTSNSQANSLSDPFKSVNNFNQPKTTFGSIPITSTTIPDSNIFTTSALSNGFGSTSNLFSASNTTNSTVNNFSNTFSQTPNFNFGSTESTNTQSSVFQFGAKSDITTNSNPLPNNIQGRFIKKAKRRLGSKE